MGMEAVVKVAQPYGPLHQPLEWLVRNRAEHVAAAQYFPVPRTYHVRMSTQDDVKVNVILQERLQGRMLSQVSDGELREPVLHNSLVATADALLKSAKWLGWLPDVIGGPPRWGMHDLRHSNNLWVDSAGRIWLIDPGALFLWFSRRNPVGWLYTSVLLASARRLVARGR